MKSNDQKLLEEAYLKIATLEEKNALKSALAGAALGLSTLGGVHADTKGMTPDDYADKEMVSYSNDKSASHLTAQEAFDLAIKQIHAGKKVSDSTLKSLATNKELAKRCASLMVFKKIELPKVLRSVVGDIDKEMKSALVGP